MPKLKYLWAEFLRKSKATLKLWKGEQILFEKPLPRSNVELGHSIRPEETPRKAGQKPVALGRSPRADTVPLGRMNYPAERRTRLPGQETIVEGDGVPDYEYDIDETNAFFSQKDLEELAAQQRRRMS